LLFFNQSRAGKLLKNIFVNSLYQRDKDCLASCELELKKLVEATDYQ